MVYIGPEYKENKKNQTLRSVKVLIKIKDPSCND